MLDKIKKNLKILDNYWVEVVHKTDSGYEIIKDIDSIQEIEENNFAIRIPADCHYYLVEKYNDKFSKFMKEIYCDSKLIIKLKDRVIYFAEKTDELVGQEFYYDLKKINAVIWAKGIIALSNDTLAEMEIVEKFV